MKTVIYLLIPLLLVGCTGKSFEYHLIAEGAVTNIEITSGGWANPAQRVFYLDTGSVYIFSIGSYENVKIGDYIYIYHKSLGFGRKKIIRRKPLN